MIPIPPPCPSLLVDALSVAQTPCKATCTETNERDGEREGDRAGWEEVGGEQVSDRDLSKCTRLVLLAYECDSVQPISQSPHPARKPHTATTHPHAPTHAAHSREARGERIGAAATQMLFFLGATQPTNRRRARWALNSLQLTQRRVYRPILIFMPSPPSPPTLNPCHPRETI